MAKKYGYGHTLFTVSQFRVPFNVTVIRQQEPPILQNIFIKDNVAKPIEREFRQSLNKLKGET